MKHHFGGRLERDSGHWTIVPNEERFDYKIGDVPVGSKNVTIVSIGRDDKNWERVFTLPHLEELTLHTPTQQQLQSVSNLIMLKRLRITYARPRDINFICSLVNLEELVLEYVSVFSDLTPLQELKNLRSLHLENLRSVREFNGLSGLKKLRYLRVDGTLDWKQPISDFEFLSKLPNLEVLSLGEVINRSRYPALLPVLALKKLKEIKLAGNILAAEEYAFLEVALPNVKGANWGPFTRYAYSSIPLPRDDVRAHLSEQTIKSNHPEVSISYNGERRINDPEDEWFEFTGKKEGRAKCDNSKSKAKCDNYSKKYQLMKEQARSVISTLG